MTVVIPVVTDLEHLQQCLAHLERERESFALDVCAVSRLPGDVGRAMRAAFPWVDLVEVDPATTIPVMRAIGVERVTTPVVAIIEDHVLVPRGWARRMAEAVDSTHGVVAGPVGDASRGRGARAAFVCEYSGALPPQAGGPRNALPGNNTGYPVEALKASAPLMREGAWEDEVHTSMAARGIPLLLEPGLEADHALEVTWHEYLALRFHYSRAWVGRRNRGAPFATRVARAAKCLALPPVLLGRILGRAIGRRQYRWVALISLPLQVLFVVAWAAGELVGNLAGPGQSLTKVR